MPEGFAANPFYAGVYHGIEQICRELRINLYISSLDIINSTLRSLPSFTHDERINGLLLVGAMPRETVDAIARSAQVPVVLIDNWYPNTPWDAVMIDNVTGVETAMDYLFECGHRQISFIGGPAHPSIVERQFGYVQAMNRHHLPPNILPTNKLEAAGGESAAAEIIRRWPETTAIVCANDLQAVGVLRKLTTLGFRVPEHFSLVGFDDIGLTQVTVPSITTVRVERDTLGRLGVELLLGRINAPQRPPIRSIVGVSLVKRDSVGLPRAMDIVATGLATQG
jgi:LacI family transcriptional regulator